MILSNLDSSDWRCELTVAKNDQKVAVAYPHPGEVAFAFHHSMLNVWRLDALGAKLADGRKVGGRGRIVAGGAHIPVTSGAVVARARNLIVREFLKLDGIDWLWMVDTDMTFESDVLECLV